MFVIHGVPEKLDLVAWGHLRRSNFFWHTVYCGENENCYFVSTKNVAPILIV